MESLPVTQPENQKKDRLELFMQDHPNASRILGLLLITSLSLIAAKAVDDMTSQNIYATTTKSIDALLGTTLSSKLAEIDLAVEKNLATAKAMADPWAARQFLTGFSRKLDRDYAICDQNILWCGSHISEARRKVRSEIDHYEAIALKNGHPGAIVSFFKNNTGSNERKNRNQYVPALLQAAEQTSGTVDYRNTLYLAGQILTDGELTVRDSNRATKYLTRAWVAGEAQAADDAAANFMIIGDHTNAYLWWIRCFEPCIRKKSENWKWQITPEIAKRAELAADDKQVLLLN